LGKGGKGDWERAGGEIPPNPFEKGGQKKVRHLSGLHRAKGAAICSPLGKGGAGGIGSGQAR